MALVSRADGPDSGKLGSFDPDPLEGEEEMLATLDAGVLPDGSRDTMLRELRTAQMELRAVFFCYSVDLSTITGPPVPGAEDIDKHAKAMPLNAWKQLCADCGIDGLSEVDEAFAGAASKTTNPYLSEIIFFAALVRLASKLADDAQDLTKSLYTLLYECILPFARRDSSTAFSQVLSSRSYLLPYLEEIRATFSGFGVSWEQWLKLWPQLRLAGLPGFPYWERQVFSALSDNLGVLLRVFSFYAKQTLMRLLSSGGAGATGSVPPRFTRTLLLGKMEWLGFVKECKVTTP